MSGVLAGRLEGGAGQGALAETEASAAGRAHESFGFPSERVADAAAPGISPLRGGAGLRSLKAFAQVRIALR